MKLTSTHLRRIIREEVRKITEATRSFSNMEADLEDMSPGDVIDLQIHTDSGIMQGNIAKRPATQDELGMNDIEDEDGFIYTLEVDDGGLEPEITDFITPYELTSFFRQNGWEFSY